MEYFPKVVIILFLYISSLCDISRALYEDHVGKFDWKKEFIGPVKYSSFRKSSNQGDVIFVGTEQNVISALSISTGEIVWRKVLEEGNRGFINYFGLVGNGVFAITGTDVIQLRGWHGKNGYLTHQWSSINSPRISDEHIVWYIQDLYVYKLVFSPKTLTYFKYRLHNGDVMAEKSFSLTQDYNKNCAINKGFLLCSYNGNILTADVTVSDFSDSSLQTQSSNFTSNSLKSIGNSRGAAFISVGTTDKLLLSLSPELEVSHIKSIDLSSDVTSTISTEGAFNLVILAHSQSKYTLELEAFKDNDLKNAVIKRRFILKYPVGKIGISSAECRKNFKGSVECLVLLSNDDGSLILLRDSGKVEWFREESLSNIITSEMIELPMSETEAEMQSEFDGEETDILSMFTRRVTSHLHQLNKFFLLGLDKSFSSGDVFNGQLVRDYFNLHKLIIVVTKQKKVFAIDNISSAILWSYLLDEEFEAFPAPTSDFDVRIPLFVQRTYRHYPFPAMCTILLREAVSKNGVAITFDPVKGKFENPIKLGYRIKQALLLPKATVSDFILGIALMDEYDTVHVFPEHANEIMREVASSLYFHVADAENCLVNGYRFSDEIESNILIPAWNIRCTGKIIQMAGKNLHEKVHSQGRVLADRNVLYKYINPNLIVIVSQSVNSEDMKSMLSLYFVDSVTGDVIMGDIKQKASSPAFLVHSENWALLVYNNEKSRRTEIVTYELHEGKQQHNSTAFSSIQARNVSPIIDSRTYILPTSSVDAVRETITEKGITSKHVLVVTSTGKVMELRWNILDPRRPYPNSHDNREEGALIYVPEITVSSENIINYNQTLYRTQRILTSPSGLESTSLTFVYGLDLFFTRVAPSKTFDLLKEDFDYMLIVIVLILLLISTFISKHLAYRKAINQAWR